MILTTFDVSDIKAKIPYSPFGDKTFEFVPLKFGKLRDMFFKMAQKNVLNLPITEKIRSKRKSQFLEKYYPEKFDYVILDINNVDSKIKFKEILNFFRSYECILGESRSYNGVDNFSLKGILKINPSTLRELKQTVQSLKEELSDFCDVDDSVSRRATQQAAILKTNIVLESFGNLYEGTTVFPKIPENFEIPKRIDMSGADSIEKMCLRFFSEMGFKLHAEIENGYNFSHACEEEDSKNGYFWFKNSPYVMHHENPRKTVNIFSEIAKIPEAKKLLKSEIQYDKIFSYDFSNTTVMNVCEKALTVSQVIKKNIESFLHSSDGLFAIKSPMGTGKSTIISEIITRAHNEDQSVLIITNRISVAEDFSKKYNLKIYNKDKYADGDSMIVQFDSLWRYSIKGFDLVIMDEFISLLMHSRQNLGNSVTNIGKFFACFSKKLVIADAFLTGYENQILKTKTKAKFLLDNSYRDSTKLFSYEDFNQFMQNLIMTAKEQPVTVSCTSTKIIGALRNLLSKLGVKTMALTADTPQATKEAIYKSFALSENPYFDCLIYSPTLTVGVSNLNNVKAHFHYDCASACDVISSIQMIKRTRNAEEIHFYIKNLVKYVKTTFAELKDQYLCNIGKTQDYSCLFDINDYGEIRLSRIGRKAVQIDVMRNILEYSHKSAFLWMLSYQFSEKCKTITKTFDSNVLLPYMKEIKTSEIEKKRKDLEDYISMSGFDREQIMMKNPNFEVFSEIESKLHCSQEIKTKILNIEINNPGFIQTCSRYKIVKEFSENIINKSEIRSKILKCIETDLENLKFWNNVIDNIKKPLKDCYTPNEIGSLKKVLEKIGYSYESKALSVNFKVSPEVLEFYKFM